MNTELINKYNELTNKLDEIKAERANIYNQLIESVGLKPGVYFVTFYSLCRWETDGYVDANMDLKKDGTLKKCATFYHIPFEKLCAFNKNYMILGTNLKDAKLKEQIANAIVSIRRHGYWSGSKYALRQYIKEAEENGLTEFAEELKSAKLEA